MQPVTRHRTYLIGLIVIATRLLCASAYAQLPASHFPAAPTWTSHPDQLPASSRDHAPGSAAMSYHDRLVPLQLYDDFTYLASQPDFYAVVGGLGLAPKIFTGAFNRESPEFTEMWGNSQLADNAFEAGEFVGQAIYPISASAAFWSIGRLARRRRLQAFGTDLFRAQAVSGLLTLALKTSINRPRPDGGVYSYPSGHTSSAFATAGVVYRHLGPRLGIPAFLLAGYVGFSRLQENKHFFTDIVAGGILGSYVGLKLGGRRFADHRVTIAPAFSAESRDLVFSARF